MKFEDQQNSEVFSEQKVVKLEKDIGLMQVQIQQLGTTNIELEKLVRAKNRNLEEAKAQLSQKDAELQDIQQKYSDKKQLTDEEMIQTDDHEEFVKRLAEKGGVEKLNQLMQCVFGKMNQIMSTQQMQFMGQSQFIPMFQGGQYPQTPYFMMNQTDKPSQKNN